MLCPAGDCVLQKTKAVFSAGGEAFTASGSVVLRPGYTAVMPWKVRKGLLLLWGELLLPEMLIAELSNLLAGVWGMTWSRRLLTA